LRSASATPTIWRFDLDGTGAYDNQTGVGFFDHMLDQLARHSLIDLTVRAAGDLHIDDHHTVEDTGIALGQALARRWATSAASGATACHLPMDEALVRAALDLSGRPFLVWDVPMTAPKIGTFDTELVREFFQALATHGGITLHVDAAAGVNSHHIAEAAFKAVARALRTAVETDPRKADAIPSTKGASEGAMLTALIDYESGNLHSAEKAFQRMARETGAGEVVVTSDADGGARRPHRAAGRRRVPGLPRGAHRRRGGLFEALREAVEVGAAVPRHLRRHAAHGHGGPGIPRDAGPWLDRRRGGGDPPADARLKVPHMGWNDLVIDRAAPRAERDRDGRPRLFRPFLPDGSGRRFKPAGACDYGGPVTAIVGRGTMVGTQFHPEKSQAAGLRLIANFLNWAPWRP
jgi:imidazoleglycerol-phosphate dehydratase